MGRSGSRQRPQARAAAPRHHDHVHRAILGTGAPRQRPGRAPQGRVSSREPRRISHPSPPESPPDSNHRAGDLVDAVRTASYHPRTDAGGAAGPTDPRSAFDHVGDAGHAPARARRRPARPSPCRRAPDPRRDRGPRARRGPARGPGRRDRQRHQAVRGRRRRRRDEPVGGQRGVLLVPRAVGLRQDDDPADDRGLRAADRRARSTSPASPSRACRRTAATSTPCSSTTRCSRT